MSKKLRKYLLFSLGLSSCLILAFSFFLLLKFIEYRTVNPPTTYTEKSGSSEDGLVFYWTFDHLDRGVTLDTGGNENHGKVKFFLNNKYLSDILYGQPETTEGKRGKALHFNGKQWISGGNKSFYNIEQFTISLWVWQESTDISMPTIMAKSSWYGSSGKGYDGWWLCTTSGTRFLDMGIAWGDDKVHIKSGYQLPLKEWHHIAVTVDNIDNEVQFFVDGQLYGEKHTNVQKWLVNWNHDLFVAGYDGSGRWSWPGKLDDVQFYAKLLTADKIFSLYTGL